MGATAAGGHSPAGHERLPPLTAAEADLYMTRRLQHVGVDRSIFTDAPREPARIGRTGSRGASTPGARPE